jgi:hypothetical protein
VETITKQPAEQFPVAIEFYGKLPPFGQTISSVVFSAIRTDTLADATSTIIVDDSEEIDDTQVQCGIKSGTSGLTYKVTATVTLSDGSILEEDYLLEVESI